MLRDTSQRRYNSTHAYEIWDNDYLYIYKNKNGQIFNRSYMKLER